jgi:predicted DNA-binding protein (UPF0251 family)
MAQDSKRKRHMRRVKREATLARLTTKLTQTTWQRNVGLLVDEMNTLKALLFALLAQAGGTLPVTKGTQEQVMENFARLRVTSALKEGDATTLLVTLVEDAKPEETPVPKVTITHPDADIDTVTTNEGAD